MRKPVTPAKRREYDQRYAATHKVEIAACIKRWQQKHKDTLKLRAQQYYLTNKKRIAVRIKAYNLEHRPESAERARRWRASNPWYLQQLNRKYNTEKKDQKYASNAVYRAVKLGRLIKPKLCQDCGAQAKIIYGHHEDYSKQLDVVWLCAICHKKAHMKADVS